MKIARANESHCEIGSCGRPSESHLLILPEPLFPLEISATAADEQPTEGKSRHSQHRDAGNFRNSERERVAASQANTLAGGDREIPLEGISEVSASRNGRVIERGRTSVRKARQDGGRSRLESSWRNGNTRLEDVIAEHLVQASCSNDGHRIIHQRVGKVVVGVQEQ